MKKQTITADPSYRSFYSKAEAARMGRRARISRLIAGGLLLGSLAGCIVMCTLVKTANAAPMLRRVIALATLGGWGALFTWVFSAFPAGAAAGHMRRILDGEAQVREGVLGPAGEIVRIPKSVAVRRAVLTEDDGTQTRLSILAGMEKELPPPETRLQVRIVHQFIEGFEER